MSSEKDAPAKDADVIKFSDHARSHFVSTERDTARGIFEREMQRRFENLEIDDPPDHREPASLSKAWWMAKRAIDAAGFTFDLDVSNTIGAMDRIHPDAGLLGGDYLPMAEAESLRELRRKFVDGAEKFHVQWCRARGDGASESSEKGLVACKNVALFAAMSCEVLDRFAPDRVEGDFPGCPQTTIERLGKQQLPTGQFTIDEEQPNDLTEGLRKAAGDDAYFPCPECGGADVYRERRPNGNTGCRSCGLELPHDEWEERMEANDDR